MNRFSDGGDWKTVFFICNDNIALGVMSNISLRIFDWCTSPTFLFRTGQQAGIHLLHSAGVALQVLLELFSVAPKT